MEKTIIEVPGISQAIRDHNVPLSPVVRAGDFVFVSGMPPFDPATGELVFGDVEVQTERVLENIKLALETAGTSLEKVVKVNVYVPNAAWFRRINAVYARYFPTDPPARTFVAMASWALEFDVEIECTAIA
jgi:reactive intermediate/imine deaminase